jgi:uncharacterized protein (DUF1330 family)
MSDPVDLFVDPSRERFGLFKDLPRDHPVQMLNLVKLRERAVYQDGQDATGEEAYAAYGRESGPVFQRLGGRIIYSGDFQFMLIGPEFENWDKIFIAEYPSGQAFIDMVYDPDYRKAVIHRQAAVQTSRLIRMKPRTSGAGFGE